MQNEFQFKEQDVTVYHGFFSINESCPKKRKKAFIQVGIESGYNH